MSVGTELAGRTLGLLGLGRQGMQVAPIGKAFGMDVVAWSQNLTAERAEQSAHGWSPRTSCSRVGLRLGASRAVGAIAAPRRRGRAAADEAERLPGQHVAGPARRQAALVAALHEGWIAGAGLDVYDVEPIPPDNPLLDAPNTVLTPHLGYVADKNYRVFYGDIVEDIAAYLAGSPIRLVERPPNR